MISQDPQFHFYSITIVYNTDTLIFSVLRENGKKIKAKCQ